MENQLTIIDKSIEVFKGGSAILHANQERADRAMQAADILIQEWKDAYAIADPIKKMAALIAVDQKSNNFLVRCRTAGSEMETARKAITQLMDTVKTMFTESENKLKPEKGGKVKEIQDNRDGLAKFKAAETARLKAEAEKKEAKAKEATELRAQWNNYIAQWCVNTIADKKLKMTAAFNSIILDNYNEKAAGLKSMTTAFDVTKIDYILPPLRHTNHVQAEIEEIRKAVNDSYDFSSFFVKYHTEVAELKQSLIDKLPSKLSELQEAEAQRLRAIEEERKRQEEIAKAKDEETRKKMEAEAERLRQQAENERIRVENEKLQREEDERRKLELEAEQKRKEAEQQIELQKANEHAQTLFDTIAEVADIPAAGATREGYSIKVKHVGGWALLFEFWFKREGVNLSLEQLEKKTFKQIKTFAEKEAKDGNKIESNFLEYEDVVKAISKKAKEKAEA